MLITSFIITAYRFNYVIKFQLNKFKSLSHNKKQQEKQQAIYNARSLNYTHFHYTKIKLLNIYLLYFFSSKYTSRLPMLLQSLCLDEAHQSYNKCSQQAKQLSYKYVQPQYTHSHQWLFWKRNSFLRGRHLGQHSNRPSCPQHPHLFLMGSLFLMPVPYPKLSIE